MKNLITFINLGILIFIMTIFAPHRNSSEKNQNKNEAAVSTSDSYQANQLSFTGDSHFNNILKKAISEVNEDIAEFIIESALARMMDLEQGKTAQLRSTSKNIKEYGELMVKDQTKMLAEIKKLAERKNVPLPQNLDKKKADGLKDLREKHGKSFDKKFIKMMILDHKRDVKKFNKATRSQDEDVQVFATKYLPVIQSHLDKIKSLK